MAESKRHKYERLRTLLYNERSTFISHWRDLGDHILPRRPRFFVTDADKGGARNQKIIDSTATLSARTLQSGMMSGVTSPARPWFRLTTPDPDLADFGPVKDWLYIVAQRMSSVFQRSNVDNMLPTIYGDMGVFATGALQLEEDFHSVIRTYAHPVGSYMIAQDESFRVNTFFRDFRMTVRQLVQKFGLVNGDRYTVDWSKFSMRVKNLWDHGDYETWIDVRHCIKPNEDFRPQSALSKHKKFASAYYEAGSSQDGGSDVASGSGDLMLSEKGYDYFPVLCPRWEVTGEDIYGTNCPGMVALGDVKQLQMGERRSFEAIEKMVRPPMVGPTWLKNQSSSILPGDVTFLDVREGQQGFKPAFEVNPRIVELEQKQDRIRQRIQRAFFEDLFLMLSESDRREITAREVDERHEEKLLALGPVLEQLNQDLLDPLIDDTYMIMERQGMIPPPPKELHQVPLRVEYISIMAEAQKLLGIESLERFANFAGNVIQRDPNAADRIDTDKILEVYGDMCSVPPGIVRSDDQVQAIRQQKQKAAQQMQQQQAIAQASQTAKNLSQADTGGDNALSQLMEQAQAGNLAPTK